jgi:mono/diheme cytochrome c family protein
MKRIVVASIVVATVVFAASAWSSMGATPTEKALQKQITALNTQVKTLKKQVNDARLAAGAAVLLTFCSDAVTADEFQGTWAALDQFYSSANGRPLVGPQTTVPGTIGGQDVCSLLGVTRSRGATPPSLGPFQQIFGAGAARYAAQLRR